jgi:hypothetical protein
MNSIYEPLFDDHLFYAQGRERPFIRGLIHLFGALVVLPILWIYFFCNCNVTQNTIYALGLYTIGCCVCWLVSFTYHHFEYELLDEIVLQKIDHACIFVKIFCIWGALFLLTLPRLKQTQAFSLYGIGLLISLIGIFVFNYTTPFVLAFYVGLIVFFLRDIFAEYNFISTIFWVFVLSLVTKFSIFVLELDIFYILHFHDVFHLINVSSMLIYAYMLFTIMNSDKYRKKVE